MPTYSGVRFNDNGDGTVTDGLTALVWLKKVDCYNGITWSTALSNANNLKDGNCSLSDGSVAGQWRLPNINELHSLGSVWPLSGSPFTGLAASLIFWSSSTHTLTYTDAWVVWFNNNYGFMTNGAKSTTGTINFWPVRGGL
jgi:hypothetical protein